MSWMVFWKNLPLLIILFDIGLALYAIESHNQTGRNIIDLRRKRLEVLRLGNKTEES